MKMIEKTRECEYNPYECCVESGGYGIVGVPRTMTSTSESTVWKFIKRIFSVICGIIGFSFVVIAIAGLFLLGDTQVNEIGGIINTFGYQIPVNIAVWIGIASVFGGAMITYAFFYICDKIWYSAL